MNGTKMKEIKVEDPVAICTRSKSCQVMALYIYLRLMVVLVKFSCIKCHSRKMPD